MASELKDLLRETLALRMKRNPSYSLRALARDLGMSASTASDVINGKSKACAETIVKVGQRLNLSSRVVETLKAAARAGATADHGGELESGLYEFNAKQFSLISKWHFLALMALLDATVYVDETDRIAEALGITPEEADQSVALLCHLDLIRQEQDGRLTHDFTSTFVPDGVAPQAMKNFHYQILDMAKRALEFVPRPKRFFEARFLCLSGEGYGEAQEILREAARKLDALSVKYQDGDRVYNVSWQLFPAHAQPEQLADPSE